MIKKILPAIVTAMAFFVLFAQLFFFHSQAHAYPAFTGEPEVGVYVRSIAFAGNTVFAASELLPLVSRATGQMQTLESMSDFADKVAQRYWRAGYTKARVWIPEQDVQNGLVTIKVAEELESRLVPRTQIVPLVPSYAFPKQQLFVN